jgi:hypothetical protein
LSTLPEKFNNNQQVYSLLEHGSISGTVTDISGRPVVEAAVLIVGDSPAHPDIAVLTDDGGRYQLDHLGVGDYTVMVNAQGRQPVLAEVTVDGAGMSTLDFVLGY